MENVGWTHRELWLVTQAVAGLCIALAGAAFGSKAWGFVGLFVTGAAVAGVVWGGQ